jgi:hypothetical protein
MCRASMHARCDAHKPDEKQRWKLNPKAAKLSRCDDEHAGGGLEYDRLFRDDPHGKATWQGDMARRH